MSGEPEASFDFASAVEAAQAIRDGRTTSVALTRHILDRIERFEPQVNAFSYLRPEEATAEAEAADARLSASGPAGPLHGVPITVKETFALTGRPCTWGMTEFADSAAGADSDVVDRLRKAGAIILGGTNVPMYVADHQSYNPMHGTSNNPYDLARTPGGSSGGSAAALAAGFGYLSVGTDIGGSIRVPSHYSGIFGLKASAGLISTNGCRPGGGRLPDGMAPLIDVAGPMARSAADLQLMLDVIAGPEKTEAKAWSWRAPKPRGEKLSDFRVGYMMDGHGVPLSSEIQPVLDQAIDVVRRSGAKLVRGWPEGLDREDLYRTYFKLLGAFLFSEMPPEQRREGPPHFHVESELMDAGARASYADAQDLIRKRLGYRAQWEAYFGDFDVFLMPVTFTPAYPHDHHPVQAERLINTPEGKRPYLAQFDWIPPATLTGCPAVVAPVGRTAGGLPVGIQIMAPMWEDATAIRFADLLTQAIGGFVPPKGYEFD